MVKKNRKIIPDNIVAKGEATGHAHRFGEGATVYEEDAQIHVMVQGKAAPLQHEEHKTIPFAPGDWTTGIKQEYDHFAEDARQVMD